MLRVADAEWAQAWRSCLPQVQTRGLDEHGFAQQISDLIAGLLVSSPPDHLWIHRIDNWFGERWMGFEAKVEGAFGVRANLLRSKRREPGATRLLLPPFHSHRMTDKQRFIRPGAFEPHQTPKSHDICDISPNGLFIWWSGNSDSNRRGTVMVYRSIVRRATAMYIDFANSNGQCWRIQRCVGAAAADAQMLLALGRDCRRA